MPTSPSLSAEVAFISNIKADGTLAFYAYDAWNYDQPATYTGGYTLAAKWGANTAGTAGGIVSYYFSPTSRWTSVEKKWLAADLAMWSAVCNISFAAATSSQTAQIVFVRGKDGGAATTPDYPDNINAGLTGGRILYQLSKATISIDTSVPGFGPIDGSFSEFGGYALLTVLHEEGHAIGLGHAGPYNGDVKEAKQQYSAYDSMLWSVMSYIDPQAPTAKYYSQYPVTGTNWGVSADGYSNAPTTWMPLDILAAQRLYGLPTSTPLSGGQTFGFNCNISGSIEPYFDFTINTTPVITIWDKGTGNTLDLSGFSAASSVNLNPGTFSSCDGLTNNICIAYNTSINTFIGGSGSDTVIGNNGSDSIVTGSGNDTLNLGAYLTAADRIDGGAGSDTLDLNGNYGAGVTFNSATVKNVDKIVLAAGHSYTLTTNNATVAAGQTLTINGSALSASNVLTFNGAAETDGHFIIIGGKGADNLTGGALSDTFTYSSAAQSTSTHYDTINDFNFSADVFDTPGVAGTITGINTALNTGTLSTASFDTNLTTAMASHLTAHHAILFKPNAGTLSGATFLVVDLNGVAGYQAGADLVIRLTGQTGTLAVGGFI
jgi:Ca2+-binding RTX toxin-like protein